VALLEGLNVGLLIPLLETLESSETDGSHWISRGIISIFGRLGLSVTLVTVLLILVAVVMLNAILKLAIYILSQRIRIDFVVWHRSNNMQKLLNADLSYFDKSRLGVMTDSLTMQSHHVGDSLHASIEIISNFGVLLAYLSMALLISPILTGICLVTMLFTFFSMQFFIARSRTIGTTQATRENELQVEAVETLSGVHVIKTFLIQRLRWLEFEDKAQMVGETAKARAKNQGAMLFVQELMLLFLVGVIVYVGVSVLDLGIAIMVALLFTMYRLMPRVSNINQQRSALAYGMAGISRVIKNVADSHPPTIISGPIPFPGLRTSISLDAASFYYDESAPVLHDVCFHLLKGEMTAIVGNSGAGKSTIVNLLLRHYDPSKGKILVDGVDLRELDLESWRSAIGLVSQDVFLFNDTVANNISLGRPGLSQTDIVYAAEQAYAHDFIQNLPKGYDTPIGDRGSNLSGGERQRLSLARAILKKPELLILDEATSSLDSLSEQLILDYIKSIKGVSTIIVVAHRLSTVKLADKILVLQDGTIAEEGNVEKLLAEEGVFAEYHRLQALN
jgi:subfamily B ATP-binding cassette protein MsbA